MSTIIKLRRSAVPGRVPTIAQLELGEIAINTADGKIYIKQYDAGSNTSNIVEFSANPVDLLELLKDVDGSGSGFDADLLDGLDSTQFLRSDEDDTFDGNLIITGNLTVSGNTTYVNTEEILLSDNVIVLNANFSGSTASENAGIEVERGDETNVILQWNETQNYWEIASGGVTGRILTTGDEGSGNGLDSDTLDGQEGTYYLDFTNFTNLPDPQIDVTLSGKVTGEGTTTLTNLGNGSISITTELANTAVTAGIYGSASQIPVFIVDEDGRLTSANTTSVRGVDSTAWYTANNTFSIETGDGSAFNTIIDSFNDISANNITVAGFVDGRDIAADGSKLDGIEVGATANQSNTEIFDAVLTLDGINSGLDADLLDGQEGTYYLDYNNFFNVPAATFDLTLTGKVTGTAFSNTGVMTLTTELANTGVTAGIYGTSTSIPVITVDEDGRLTTVSTVSVAGVDSTDWYSANNTYQIVTGDGSIYNTVIDVFEDITVDDLTVTSIITQTNATVNGNIIVVGTVDGRDVSVDGTKLDGIEPGATADQTASEILTLVKTVDGTGSGLDADLLDGQQGTHYLDFTNFTNLPDPQVDVALTGKVTGTGSTTLTNLGNGTISITTELSNTGIIAGSYGSSSQIPVFTVDEDGRLTSANTATIRGVDNLNWYSSNNTLSIEAGNGEIFNAIINSFNNISANNITVDGLVDGRDIAADGSKLDGIELGATADQTASEILTAIKTVDGAGSGLDADLLDGQEGTYYLDYDNFTNTPTDTDILNQIKTVDGAGSGLDADLLDGQQGTYYLDYDNFTNTPTDTDILNQIKTVDGTGSGLDADLLDGQEGTYYLDYDNFTNTPTAAEILTAIKTVDGAGSGLDADLLDGYTSQDFFDNANNVVTSFVSNAEITITAGDALTGGGIFGLNQTASLEITINHDDTSSVANVNNSNGTVLQDITFDTFGHVQTIGSVDLDGRYYTETESDAKYVLQTTQVIAGTALTGGGALSSNVTINHGDTSSASSVNNSNGTVIQDITIDTHGHVTALGSANLDDRYYTETELDAGQLDNRYYTETELDVFLSGKVDNTVNILAGSGLSGGGPLTANVTISHADTSSQANTSLSGSEFITTLNLDTFGHVVGVTKETRNFLTEADADLRYVNIDGDTMTGDLTVQANIIQDHAAYVTATATTTTIFGTQIWSFDSTIYNSAEVIITMTQGINRHITKLLIVHNGSTAAATEFGTIYTNTSLASFDVGLSGGNVTLTATPSNATSTVYKIAATLIID